MLLKEEKATAPKATTPETSVKNIVSDSITPENAAPSIESFEGLARKKSIISDIKHSMKGNSTMFTIDGVLRPVNQSLGLGLINQFGILVMTEDDVDGSNIVDDMKFMMFKEKFVNAGKVVMSFVETFGGYYTYTDDGEYVFKTTVGDTDEEYDVDFAFMNDMSIEFK